jgi:arsenate reductase
MFSGLMKMSVEIYHNPRCSKSRQTLALLEEKGIKPTIVKYLENPPDAATLNRILNILKLEPRDLMRKKEKEYKELGLDNPDLGRDDLIKAMVENPILIERPIVIKDGETASLGRPPEQVLELF